MIKIKTGSIETEGDGLDLLAEATIALTEVTRRLSDGDSIAATIFMFTMINTAIKELEKCGIEIDKDMLVHDLDHDTQYDETDETE